MPALLLLVTLLSHDDGQGRDQYKNPKDVKAYVAAQEAPDRAGWQMPEQVLDALELGPGKVVCDIGAGPGRNHVPKPGPRRVRVGGQFTGKAHCRRGGSSARLLMKACAPAFTLARGV